MRNVIIVVLLILNFRIESSEIFHSSSIPEVIWNEVTPYLMPADHPAKPVLDRIFSKPKVIQNRSTMQEAGFTISKPRKWDNIFIATHKKLKGYVIKLYTDEQGILPDWYNWVKRAQGALVIQQAIEKHGYQNMFSVPKKWIYPLPRIAEKPEQKSFILIVENMDLLSDLQNKKAWKNTKNVTKKKLLALFILLKEEGLIDSIYVDNIPFSKSGHIAFIDTEHYHKHENRIRYDRLTPRLLSELRMFWNHLTQ